MKNEKINLVHCGTNDHVVNVFTKALTHQKFEHFLGALGMCKSSDHVERVGASSEWCFENLALSMHTWRVTWLIS